MQCVEVVKTFVPHYSKVFKNLENIMNILIMH